MTRHNDTLVSTAYDLGEESFRITAENDVAAGLSGAVSEAKAAIKEIDSLDANPEVNLKNKEFLAEIARCDAELKKLAAMKADPEVDLDDKAFDVAAASILAKKELLAKKVEIPVDMDRSAISRGASALAGLHKELSGGENIIKRWATSLGKVRIQMGFLSGTLRQATIGMTLLGPVVFGLIGTVSSLIGVLGTGLLGAVSVGGAAMTGFGLVVAGLMPSLKQLFTELKSAPSVMGPLQQMRDTLTGDIRQDFFQMAHQGVKTLQSDFPVFRQGATAAFGAAEQGWRQWMQGLRSPEAKNILRDILSNFTDSVPKLMQGLGSLGAMMGRVFGSASKFLPSLSGGFAKWAQQLSTAIGSGAELDTKMGRLVTHMRDVGHLAQASGRAIVTFFNAGADSGDSLVNSLTGVINKWTSWMQSTAGRNSLADFFQRSQDLARQLFPAIGRIATALANVSVAAEPLSEGIAAGLNALAKVAAALPPSLLQAAGAMLIFGKAMSFITGGRAALLFGEMAAGIKTLLPMAGALRAAFGVGGLTTALSQAGVAAGALAGVGALGGFGALFGGVVIGATLLSNKMDEMDDATKAAIVSFQHQNALVKELPTTYSAYRQAMQATKGAQDAYNQALKQSGAKSRETAVAQRELNAAIRQQNAELASLRARGLASYNMGIGEAARSTANLNRYLQSSDPYFQQVASGFATAAGRGQEFQAAVARNGTSVIGLARSLQQVGLSVKQVGLQNLPMLQNALQQFNQTQQGAAANVVNYARSLKGLGPVTGAAAQQVGKFVQQFGQVKGAKRAVISTNAPAEAAKVARLSTQLNKVGQRKAVVRIMAEGGNADQIIDKLQKKVDGVNRKKGVAKLEAQDNTGGKIEQAKGKLDGFAKKYDATMHVLGADAARSAAQQATAAVNAFPTGTRTMNLVTNYQQHGSPPGHYRGGIIPGFAAGADEKMMANAMSSAANRQPLDGRRGARVSNPTYIAGEERKTEYVIATNPQYRRANEQYLMAAASEFGYMMIVPGHKKGKKGGKGQPSKGDPHATLDNATDSTSKYAFWSQQVQYDADIVSLFTRYMEAGTKSVAQVQEKIGVEIADYGTLAGIIQGILGSRAIMDQIPNSMKPKKLSKKAQEKHPKKAEKIQKQRDQIDEHNRSAREGKLDLDSELRGILDVIIPGLWLDFDQVKSQAESLAFQNVETAGGLRQQVFQQYAGNLLAGGATTPIVGATGLQSGTTTPPLAAATTVMQTTSAATSLAPPAATASSGTTGVVINQQFDAPPPDPHTYAQSVAFEIGAAV